MRPHQAGVTALGSRRDRQLPARPPRKAPASTRSHSAGSPGPGTAGPSLWGAAFRSQEGSRPWPAPSRAGGPGTGASPSSRGSRARVAVETSAWARCSVRLCAPAPARQRGPSTDNYRARSPGGAPSAPTLAGVSLSVNAIRAESSITNANKAASAETLK